MTSYNFLGFELSYIVVFAGFILVWLAAGIIFKKIVFVWIKSLTKKTETDVDDILIEAAKTPAFVLILTSGAASAFRILVPIAHKTHLVPFVPLSLKVISIFAIILFVDCAVMGLLKNYSAKIDVLRMSQGFIGAVVRILIYSIGILVILDSIGVSITPIIASLGIGSLAIALALQPTLENIFSGFQIILDQPVNPGDFIRLESGEEGFVERVGWRSTWIRQLPNNMVIIPNKTLVNSRVLNYHYPSKELAMVVELGVHYNSDLDNVERTIVSVGEQVLKNVEGGVPEFTPIVRFHAFADSSISVSAILRARQVTDIGLLKHEFIKALNARFSKEGIVIPYPIRALNTNQEKAIL